MREATGSAPEHPRAVPPWEGMLVQDVLPWWVEHAADDARGGVLTCFDNRGTLLSTDKYTWSQGRWAWLCAELAHEARAGRLPLVPQEWEDRAAATARLLLDHAVLADGSTAFRMTEHGRPIPDERDGSLSTSVFADLFAALGIGAAVRQGSLEAAALDTCALILEHAAQRVARRIARTDPYPVPPGHESLAGWMNLLHTASELLRAPASLLEPHGRGERIAAVRDAALARLLGGTGEAPLVGTDSWWELRPDGPRADTLLARHRTPGHLLELLWMLVHAEETGGPRLPDGQLERLALEALRIGWDAEHDGILRYSDREGGEPAGEPAPTPAPPYEQLVRSTWDTKLWWVHAEAMYATDLLARRTGSRELAAWHRRVSDYTLRTFPDDENGEWVQIRDREGRPLDQVVALPVKDPFHISRALLLLSRATSTKGTR